MSVTTKAGRRFIDWPQLKLRVPFTRQHLLRLERAGRFPKRVQIGDCRVAWVEEEIEAWIEARVAERDRPAAA
jgi:prophage regulatory protein